MRDTIKGAILGAFVAAAVSVLLAQTTPSWTSPRTWATDDLLTASQFNAQIRDNFLNMRGFAACAENGTTGTSSAGTVLYGDCRWDAAAAVTIAELGCTGTRNSSTVLFGDCTWAELPTTTVVALDMGETHTTASTYQTFGPSASLEATSGQTITAYFSGTANILSSGTNCQFRVYNSSTDTTFFDYSFGGQNRRYFTSIPSVDSSPSTTTANVYVAQMRRTSGSGSCSAAVWTSPGGQRGMIVVVT